MFINNLINTTKSENITAHFIRAEHKCNGLFFSFCENIFGLVITCHTSLLMIRFAILFNWPMKSSRILNFHNNCAKYQMVTTLREKSFYGIFRRPSRFTPMTLCKKSAQLLTSHSDPKVNRIILYVRQNLGLVNITLAWSVLECYLQCRCRMFRDAISPCSCLSAKYLAAMTKATTITMNKEGE